MRSELTDLTPGSKFKLVVDPKMFGSGKSFSALMVNTRWLLDDPRSRGLSDCLWRPGFN